MTQVHPSTAVLQPPFSGNYAFLGEDEYATSVGTIVVDGNNDWSFGGWFRLVDIPDPYVFAKLMTGWDYSSETSVSLGVSSSTSGIFPMVQNGGRIELLRRSGS